MCSEEIQCLLSGHLDGCNTPEQEATLQAHLVQCPQCRQTLEEYRKMDAALAGMAKEPPASLSGSVLQAISQEIPQPKKPRKLPFRYASAIAAVVAIALLAVSYSGIALPNTGATSIFTYSKDVPAAEAEEAPASEPASAAEITASSVASSSASLHANVDCAALAKAENCTVGVLYTQEDTLPELSDAVSLPLSGGVRYTITQKQLEELQKNYELLLYSPESGPLSSDARAYLIVVTQ